MAKHTSYKTIFNISAPIMLGSAAQNVIALSDSVLLYHLSESDFAAIGFVSVFYLTIAAIGYGFSKGGQILIARRNGEDDIKAIGKTFYGMVYFELFLAVLMFLFMKFGGAFFFSLFVDSPVIFEKSLEYLDYRSYSVFFSYVGVSIIALYTGVAKTKFIIIDTLILASVNIFLNYGLIFGKFGLPEMGISGAGLASTIAEIVAFIAFLIYMFYDKMNIKIGLWKLPKLNTQIIKDIFSISSPIVFQGIVGIGSWFVFFGLIENLGERELAISNLIRMIYLVLAIPVWGYASGINTIVSNFIGRKKRMAVLPMINKTAKLSFWSTILFALPIVIWPEFILYPILGGPDTTLISDAQPIFYILLLILGIFAFGGVYFNGLTGIGSTLYGLKLQSICTVIYLVYIIVVIKFMNATLPWAWASEIIYWLSISAFSLKYLTSDEWHKLKI
jgi:putative MATE family efflux protein